MTPILKRAQDVTAKYSTITVEHDEAEGVIWIRKKGVHHVLGIKVGKPPHTREDLARLGRQIDIEAHNFLIRLKGLTA